MKASFPLEARTSLIPHVLRNIPAHRHHFSVDCVCLLLFSTIGSLSSDRIPSLSASCDSTLLAASTQANCSSMLLIESLSIDLRLHERLAQRTQRLLFKMETKLLTKHNAELFEYCRILRSAITFSNAHVADRKYFESWSIHRKSGCEVGQMDLLGGSLRPLCVCSWPHRKMVRDRCVCSKGQRLTCCVKIFTTSKLNRVSAT